MARKPHRRDPRAISLSALRNACLSSDDFLECLSVLVWRHHGLSGAFPSGCKATATKLGEWLRFTMGDDKKCRPAWYPRSLALYREILRKRNRADQLEWRWTCSTIGDREIFTLCLLQNGRASDFVRALQLNWDGRDIQLHPLCDMVWAWQQERGMRRVKPDQFSNGILPSPFAKYPALGAAQPRVPALIEGLYSGPSGAPANRTGRVSVAERLLLELLLAVPRTSRRKFELSATTFVLPLRTIVVDWLAWNPSWYRSTGASTGQLVKQAVEKIHEWRLPFGTEGGYINPCVVQYVSGWRLRDEIRFAVLLPAGSQVGPGCDRETFRKFRDDAPAWRALVSLTCIWDRQGGHNGRLVRPKRPVVMRDAQGRIIDACQELILVDGEPSWSAHHPLAVLTGGREDNPHRTRYSPAGAGAILMLAYPLDTLPASPRVIHSYRRRACCAVQRVEQANACAIEKLGSGKIGLPWRVMPPDIVSDTYSRKDPQAGM